MKILSAEEVRAWDQYTIANEPIASIDLMERASLKCTEWLISAFPEATSFGIYCGKGNNGGDGLAIARMLHERQYNVSVYILEFGHLGTEDFQTNLGRLHQLSFSDIHFIQSTGNFHKIPKREIIIDALFGSGLNRKLEGITANLVDHLNDSGNTIVSIDIASGLFVDRSSKGNKAIEPNYTLSFQCYKPAFLFAENEKHVGELNLLDIGLLSSYPDSLNGQFELLDTEIIHSIYKTRNQFSHKGSFGHALILAGSYGKMGAALLAAKACLRSGAGLVTCHVPACGYEIMQAAFPEAMVLTDADPKKITKCVAVFETYKAVAIGPGIGTEAATKMLLQDVCNQYNLPMVIDADALNIIASQKEMLSTIPVGSILTPHPKEFERLFGSTANEFDRVMFCLEKAKELHCVIILKGHHTFIATPGGKGFFNATGNAGMATAGSGDVLTGILSGLLAQGYSSVDTAILAVYLHGLAGDLAAKEMSMEAMIASDIIENIGTAYMHLQ